MYVMNWLIVLYEYFIYFMMSTLLIQVFTGELDICLKIKEHQVHHVFHLIAYGGNIGRPELLRMLQAVVKVCKILYHTYLVNCLID